MPNQLYSADAGGGDVHSIAEICQELQRRINQQFDNREDPGSFPDWQKAMRKRDETLFQLGAAVITLSRIVKDLAQDIDGLDDQERGR